MHVSRQLKQRTIRQITIVAGDEEEELDNDAMGIEELPMGTGFDQFGHMMGSGSPATRARRLELAGKHAHLASRVRSGTCLLVTLACTHTAAAAEKCSRGHIECCCCNKSNDQLCPYIAWLVLAVHGGSQKCRHSLAVLSAVATSAKAS